MVPAATGKLNICAANTKAAVMPANGTAFSFSCSLARRKEKPTAPALITPVAAAVPALRKPSGACSGRSFQRLLRSYRICDTIAKAS